MQYAAVFAIEALFSQRGFERCDSPELEPGVEKIAVFGDDKFGEAKHVARQCASGKWASKMGDHGDIEHDLEVVAGSFFGTVQLIMRKQPKQAMPD